MSKTQHASLGKRVGAFMIDLLISACVQALLFIPFIIIPLVQKTISGAEVTSRNLYITLVVFTYLLLRDLPHGRSIGKKALRLQARSSNAEPASSSQLVLRNLFVVLYPVEAIWLIASSGRRRLGDIAARTGVFEYEAEEKQEHTYYRK